jgi:hypothetical protein
LRGENIRELCANDFPYLKDVFEASHRHLVHFLQGGSGERLGIFPEEKSEKKNVVRRD